jgi:glycerophosphoryl diester phosphodiesterase
MKPLHKRKWLWFLATFILLFILVKIYNLDLFSPDPQASEPIWIAHRGASGYAPENTLAAFDSALARRADMIELDVHFSQDQQLVVIHDPTLERTTNGTGKVEAHTVAELKQLDAGSWFGERFSDQGIPSLAEVLVHVNGRVPLLIELKWGEAGIYPGLEDSLIALLDRHQARNWCEIQSFDAQIVRRVRALAPEMKVHKLILLDLPVVPGHIDRQWQWSDGSRFDEDIDGINLWIRGMNPRLVNRIKTAGKSVYVYTANSPVQVQYCRELGVEGVISDFAVGPLRQ